MKTTRCSTQEQYGAGGAGGGGGAMAGFVRWSSQLGFGTSAQQSRMLTEEFELYKPKLQQIFSAGAGCRETSWGVLARKPLKPQTGALGCGFWDRGLQGYSLVARIMALKISAAASQRLAFSQALVAELWQMRLGGSASLIMLR